MTTHADEAKINRVLDRIHKLMALKASPNEHEATLAATRIAEILAEYKIEMAQVEAHTSSKKKPTTTHKRGSMGVQKSMNHKWCVFLATNVAKVTYTKCIYWDKLKELVFIGDPADVEVAHELYSYLARQGLVFCEREWATLPKAEKVRYSRFGEFRLSFMCGFVDRVGDRLEEQYLKMCAESETLSAIVRVAGAENEEYARREFSPKQKTIKVRVEPRSYSRGDSAGRLADLSPAPKLVETD